MTQMNTDEEWLSDGKCRVTGLVDGVIATSTQPYSSSVFICVI
jgi:hypothetical protein